MDLLKFLNDDEYAIDPKAAAKELGPNAARCWTPRWPH